MTKRSPIRYFRTSSEIICLAVMMYVRFPRSLRNVEDLLHERGIDVCYETIRLWRNRFGPLFAAEIRKKRVEPLRSWPQWRWHPDEIFVNISGQEHDLWRAVNHEGKVLESFVTNTRDKKSASVHASVSTHFIKERHLYSRNCLKTNCAATCAKWRQVGAV